MVAALNLVQPVAPDGTLRRWSEISDDGWCSILIGNGLSINLSRFFGYQSLFAEATKQFDGCLSEPDRALFEALGTTNFEAVLADLRIAAMAAEALGEDPAPYRDRFKSVQAALGAAVRRVHLEWSEIPEDTLGAIKADLRQYDAIFSTSYDLITYWAIIHGEDYGRFRDCFWSNERNEFDPESCEVFPGYRPVYYMHGALHLVVDGAGVTRKLVGGTSTLLDQFGKPIPGERETSPLLITETSARDKMRGIEGNDYLAHAYETFRRQDGPLLVFGHSLSAQDRHLIDAINEHPDRPVAVSMVRKGRQELRERQSEIWGKLHTEDVRFYDAATHPLGDSALTTNGPRFRSMGKWMSAHATAASSD